MMNSRYDFHPETYSSLKVFLEKSKNRKSNIDKESRKVWKYLLPKNELLLKQLQDDSEEVIEIHNSDSQTSEVHNEVEVSSVHSYTSYEKKCIADIARDVIEALKSDDRVMEVVLNLTESELDELFSYFVQNQSFNTEMVCIFGQQIAFNTHPERDKVLQYFCRHLLINELKEKEEEHVRKTFISFLTSNPTIVCNELAKYCVSIGNDKCPRALDGYLKHLQGEYREQLLREFVLNCAKVESGHFSILESLVVGQMDLGVLKKLIDLFAASSNEFGSNKSFGKLLVHVLQKIGNQIYRFEATVQIIISHHKSPWRNKILKTYESNAGNISQNSLSQII